MPDINTLLQVHNAKSAPIRAIHNWFGSKRVP